jgi:hypothetical protein
LIANEIYNDRFRPNSDNEIRELIKRMSLENPLLGTPRIQTAKPSNKKKAEAWKPLGMCAESPASGARFVGQLQ